MKKTIVVAALIFNSAAFADANRDVITQCSVVGTMLSAVSLRDAWPQQAKDNIDWLLEKYTKLGVREHGSMAKFAEYNRIHSNGFYGWIKTQPESVLIQRMKKCADWQPQ